jgi:hypothetical protein
MVQYIRDGLRVNVFCAMTFDKVYGPSFFVEKTITETLLWHVGNLLNAPHASREIWFFFPNRIVCCHISEHSCLITESPESVNFLATEFTKSNPPLHFVCGSIQEWSSYLPLSALFIPVKTQTCLLETWKLWNTIVIMCHRSMLCQINKHKNNTSICKNAS